MEVKFLFIDHTNNVGGIFLVAVEFEVIWTVPKTHIGSIFQEKAFPHQNSARSRQLHKKSVSGCHGHNPDFNFSVMAWGWHISRQVGPPPAIVGPDRGCEWCTRESRERMRHVFFSTMLVFFWVEWLACWCEWFTHCSGCTKIDVNKKNMRRFQEAETEEAQEMMRS